MSIAKKSIPPTEEPVLAWHFRSAAGTTPYLKTPEVVGQVYSVTGRIECCFNGLHGSIRALDALEFGNSDTAMICRTRHSGAIARQDNKIASEHRVVLWRADCTAVLHEFGCWCAEQSFEVIRKAGQPIDPRCLATVDAKRKWMRGEISNQELAAARAAAWDAAWATANAAAWAAANAAVWAAACGAAWGAACGAAWGAQNMRLEEMLLALAPQEVTL